MQAAQRRQNLPPLRGSIFVVPPDTGLKPGAVASRGAARRGDDPNRPNTPAPETPQTLQTLPDTDEVNVLTDFSRHENTL